MPPAFNLSQDQTLQLIFLIPRSLSTLGEIIKEVLTCIYPPHHGLHRRTADKVFIEPPREERLDTLMAINAFAKSLVLDD